MKKKRVIAAVIACAATMVFMASGVQQTAFAGQAKAGKVSADAGDPGKDYMAYVKAVQKRDGATIRKMADVPPGTSDKDFKAQMEMVAAMTPTDQKIVSETMNGNTAVLKVAGMQDGKKQYGTIAMQKKGGVWKITKEDWSDKEKK